MSTKKRKGGNALTRQIEHPIYVQSNQLVEAHYKEALSLWELFLFSKMCSMIEAEDTDFKTYKIYIKDALDYLGIKKGGHNYRYVVEAAQRLLDRRITTYYVNEAGKTIAVDTHLVNSVHRLAAPEEDEASLFVALTFPPELKSSLLQLKDNFTMLDLDVFKYLKTPTSVRMYQLLAAHLWKKDKKVEYTLEDLKLKLGVAEKYDQYGAFKVYVLNEAQKRLDENGHIRFTYTEVKSGKKITSIIFHLTDKRVGERKLAAAADKPAKDKANLPIVLLNPEEAMHDRLVAELSPVVVIQFGVSLRVFSQLVAANTEGGIRQAVRVTEQALKTRKIENPAGYFVEAVRGHYAEAEDKKKRGEAAQQVQRTAADESDRRQKEQAAQVKRDKFQQELNTLHKLVDDDAALQMALIEEVQQGMFAATYQADLSFAENLANPLMVSVFIAAAKKLRAEAFTLFIAD